MHGFQLDSIGIQCVRSRCLNHWCESSRKGKYLVECFVYIYIYMGCAHVSMHCSMCAVEWHGGGGTGTCHCVLV